MPATDNLPSVGSRNTLRRETRDTQTSTGLVLIVAEQVDTVDEKSIVAFRYATAPYPDEATMRFLR
jgi:hypothetical protein